MWALLLFSFLLTLVSSENISPGQLTRKGRKRSGGVSAVTCQICKGTWLPLLRLSFQKYVEMPVDRCNEMWSALLGISSKPVLFLVSDSHYSVPGKLTTAVHSGRAQVSVMCMLIRTEELKSAGISEAWVLASFPAFVPSVVVVGCQWE